MPPIYDYHCEKCNKDYEVLKSIKDYDGKDPCPKCNLVGYRKISIVTFMGTKIEDAEFNQGLGCITKSKKHRDELAKRMNLVEIGNEKPETIHGTFDKQREEKRKKSWEEI